MASASAPTAHGRTADGFERVRTAFAEVLAQHPGGANLALYRGGEEVVNLWGGSNLATGQEFTEDALVMTASCTKGITTICALMLADSGRLDLDAPVAEYWPEFAAITTMPPRFGLGFQLPRPQIDAMLGAGSFGHTGAGGRLAFAHPELGVAFGFTCDAMMWDGLTGPDPRWTPLLAAIGSALDA